MATTIFQNNLAPREHMINKQESDQCQDLTNSKI